MNDATVSNGLHGVQGRRLLREPRTWRIACVASFALLLVCATATAFRFVEGSSAFNRSEALLVESERLLDADRLDEASATRSEASATRSEADAVLPEGTSASVACSSWAVACSVFGLACDLSGSRAERLAGESN